MAGSADKQDLVREMAVRRHRWWREHRETVAHLVTELRHAATPAALYVWQQRLLARYLEAQERGAIARQAKADLRGSLRAGIEDADKRRRTSKALADAEADRRVCNAVQSSLRDVGDAAAWKIIGYRRGTISAVGHGERVDQMARDGGLTAEIDEIEWLWREKQIFALHCDLTNCLRHGDLLSIETFDPPTLRVTEIKTGRQPSASHPQIKRLKRLTEILAGSPGTGPYPPQECPVRLRAHHGQVAKLIGRARETTYAWTELEPGYALTVIDERDPGRLGVDGLDDARNRQLTRQGWGTLGGDGPTELSNSTMHKVSADRRASFAGQAPLSLLPFDPVTVAELMCGPLIYWVSVDAGQLERRLREAGIHAEVARGREASELFLSAWMGDRQITVPAPTRDMLLIETLTLDSVVSLVWWLLTRGPTDGGTEFVLDFTDESVLWTTHHC